MVELGRMACKHMKPSCEMITPKWTTSMKLCQQCAVDGSKEPSAITEKGFVNSRSIQQVCREKVHAVPLPQLCTTRSRKRNLSSYSCKASVGLLNMYNLKILKKLLDLTKKNENPPLSTCAPTFENLTR